MDIPERQELKFAAVNQRIPQGRKEKGLKGKKYILSGGYLWESLVISSRTVKANVYCPVCAEPPRLIHTISP